MSSKGQTLIINQHLYYFVFLYILYFSINALDFRLNFYSIEIIANFFILSVLKNFIRKVLKNFITISK